jgi:hypothetical protein
MERAASRPDHVSFFRGEWLCENGQCPAQEVRLHVKDLHHCLLPRLRCPLCLRQLIFRHWLSVRRPDRDPAGVIPPL